MVFQDYLLFPHLSALDNVAFGPRCARRRPAPRPGRTRARLARPGRPGRARANASRGSSPAARPSGWRWPARWPPSPELLLLDEPLAALDARTRLDTRAELRRHLAEHPGATVLVTHDPLDAMVLADRLVIIEDGAVVQAGDAAAMHRPAAHRLRGPAGRPQPLPGHAADGGVRVADGLTLAVTDRVGGEVFVAFPPSAVAMLPRTARRAARATCGRRPSAASRRHGDNLRIVLNGPIEAAADVTPAAAAELGLTAGQQVWASVKATETHAYPA